MPPYGKKLTTTTIERSWINRSRTISHVPLTIYSVGGRFVGRVERHFQDGGQDLSKEDSPSCVRCGISGSANAAYSQHRTFAKSFPARRPDRLLASVTAVLGDGEIGCTSRETDARLSQNDMRHQLARLFDGCRCTHHAGRCGCAGCGWKPVSKI